MKRHMTKGYVMVKPYPNDTPNFALAGLDNLYVVVDFGPEACEELCIDLEQGDIAQLGGETWHEPYNKELTVVEPWTIHAVFKK